MAHDALSSYLDDFYTLLEGGFLAVNRADEDSAIKLFNAAQVLRPKDAFPKVGLGYMHLCKLELNQALGLFEEVLKKDPNNELAKTLKGITMSMSPKEGSKGEVLLGEIAKDSSNSDMKTLANTAMNFVEEFVKKSPSPMDTQNKRPRK